MIARRLRSARVDDTGASLPLVLAFVTGVGIMVTALLAYSSTSLTGLESTSHRVSVDYDADGALKAAVSQIRQSTFVNATPGAASCGKYLNDPAGASAATFLSYDGENLGRTLAVTCQGGPKTGLDGGVAGITHDNRPDHSVLSLGQAGSDWSMQLSDSNSEYAIKGSVHVNSDPGTNPGTIRVSGPFTARGSCANIESPAKDCSGTNAVKPDPGASSSDYDQPTPTGGLQYRKVPACPASGNTVKLSPGYYDDSAALETLTGGGCSTARTVWFQPGVYWFDFRNGDGGPYPAGDHTWAISNGNVRVIAGTPAGWTEATGYTGAATATASACISPTDTIDSSLGATFVFGGDSGLDVTGGRFEICGSYSPDKPPFAIYGGKTALGGSTDTVAAKWNHATAEVPADSTAYADLDRIATDGDADTSAASATATRSDPAAVRLPDLSPGISIPAGAKLTGATLTVDHREARNPTGSDARVADPAITLTPAGSATALTVSGATKQLSSTYKRETLDVRDLLDGHVHDSGLSGLALTWSQSVTHNSTTATSYLEYVALSLTWELPTFTAQSASTAPTILNGPATDTGAFIRGMTYAPRSAVVVDLKKDSRMTFLWGLVSKSLTVKTFGNTSQPTTLPLFGLPDDVHGPDVYFTAYSYLCPGGETVCTSPTFPSPPTAPASGSGWKVVGTARVLYDDGYDIATPQAGNRATTVHSWTTYR